MSRVKCHRWRWFARIETRAHDHALRKGRHRAARRDAVLVDGGSLELAHVDRLWIEFILTKIRHALQAWANTERYRRPAAQ